MVLGFGEYFSYSLLHIKALVINHQFNPIQAMATQPLEGTDPTRLVLFHALSGAQNLTVSILIDRNRYQNGYILGATVENVSIGV